MLEDAERLRSRAWLDRHVIKMDPAGNLHEWDEERDGKEIKELFIAVGIAVDKHLTLAGLGAAERDRPALDVFVQGMGISPETLGAISTPADGVH